MSALLWKYYLEDDVDNFRHVLEEASVATRPSGQRGNTTGQQGNGGFAFGVGSPGGNFGSPGASYDSKRVSGVRSGLTTRKTFYDVTLTRSDINRKDGKGMTLLHYAASATHDNTIGFALALLAHPLVDLYAQDHENGWTALHRAFYFGNVTIARAILEREAQDAIGQGSGGGVASGALNLIKIKDREGNGPYDVLTATIKDRTLQHRDQNGHLPFGSGREDEDEEEPEPLSYDDNESNSRKAIVKPLVDVDGDELYTFGSNKNITLGLGNQDDRNYPERAALKKPDHLYKRFFREHIEQRAAESESTCPTYAERVRSKLRQARAPTELPSVVRFRNDKVQDVQMSKFHTAVLTNDPVSNLYICGHGLGGRLGTGDQKTQFSFVCIEGFGSNRQKINAVALGQDHTIAVTDQGEVFSWGSNAVGQLGLATPKASLNVEDNIELLPKQIFGPLKRELVIGVAASRIHSVAHTSSALYTWGKNEGQLGIVDAHAGSLGIQATPRRVAASRFSCAIQSVSAIDRATICLLENHEVHVFANYGIVKVLFPLDGFANSFMKKAFLTTRYDDTPNCIIKVTGGGDTICALSSAGEIYSVTVDQRLDPGSSSTMSTTNPNKIKAALSAPARVWSLKKGHMTAKDVGVDQDGSIILTTIAGTVWRRVRRATLSSGRGANAADRKSKEFKFSRVPGLTRVLAVRASGFGAYCAMRSECDVTRTQLQPADKSLWHDTHALLSFKNFVVEEDSDSENPTPRFWSRKPDALTRLIACLANSKDLEKELGALLQASPNEHSENYDALLCTTASEIRIPVHRFMLASRSRVLRQLFAESRESGFKCELFDITSDDFGRTLVTFQGLDFLTVVELVLYIYTDAFVGFWLRSRHAPHLAYRYRQVRTELMKITSRLDLRNLELAARLMSPTAKPSLDKDMELSVVESEFFQDGNAQLELADGEVLVHTDLVSRRCPFFQGLFQGRAGGRWLAERRDLLSSPGEAISIDMTHVELHVFQLVLRHIYADTGEELFDDIVTKDLDEFLDFVLEVLSVANELMLDRLSQICQTVIGRYVNARNVCQLLNATAPSAITEFKDAGLEYLCLNLEAMLSSHLLDELEEDLLHELDAVVRDNQLATLPFAKSGHAELLLHEKYPQLAMQLDRARRAKIDSINFQTKFADPGTSFGMFGDLAFADELSPTSVRPKTRRRPSGHSSAQQTPLMKPLSPLLTSQDEHVLRDRQSLSEIKHTRSPVVTVSSPNIEASPAGPQPSMGQTASGKAFMLPPSATSEDLSTSLSAAAPSPTTPRNSSGASTPWSKGPLPSSKLTIKEIMDQTAVRTSNISLALASQAKTTLGPTPIAGPSSVRTSQKERKRQQSLQHSDSSASAPNRSSSSSWQTVGVKPKPTGKSATNEGTSVPLLAMPAAQPQRTPSTPQLTMRQTVANASTASKQKDIPPMTPSRPTVNPVQQRSVSGTNPQTPRPSPLPAPSSSSAAKPVEVQSIRHTPRSPADISPTFYMHQSMADIFSQQAAEKVEKQEAVAKRSLAEIQQEQEFLTWWDNESQRLLEEEAMAAKAIEQGQTKPKGKGRGGRSRGAAGESATRGRGNGRGRGGGGMDGGGRRGGKSKATASAPPTPGVAAGSPPLNPS